MNAETANINWAQCLKTASDFGADHVYNVCAGTMKTVPWGSADWALAIGLGGVGVVGLLVFGCMAVSIARDSF